MVSHHPEKSDGHRHCGSVYMIILVVEEEHSRWSCFNHNYCLSLKDMTWKHTAYYINSSNLDHTCLKQQLERSLKITFASPSRKGDEKKKREEKLEWRLQSLKLHTNAVIADPLSQNLPVSYYKRLQKTINFLITDLKF